MKANHRPPQPPQWAEHLLEWLAAPHLLEELQGDLYELFHKRLQRYGPGKARLFYLLDLLRLIHPRLWRRKPSPYPPFNPVIMFRHNLLLTYRTFLRFKSSFFINLIGLSTGLAAALLIYLWVNDELSVDKFHEKDRQLYQVMLNIPLVNGIQTQESTPGLLAKTLAEEMPEVEYAVSVQSAYGMGSVLSAGDKHMKAKPQFVGKDYFNVFSYKLIHGNKDQVLSNKYAVLLSEEMAMKLFHTTKNSIGKTVQWGDEKEQYLVSGIFKNPPSNATAQFDLLFTYELLFERGGADAQHWGNCNPATYVILKKGTNVGQFNNKIAGFIKSKYEKSTVTLFTRKYSDKYLYNKYENGVLAGGRIEYVRLFSVIALFILVIACINFMNLSTAKAARRLKEVGIKKVVGASRDTLIFQYLGESMLMTFLSLLMALALVALFLPQFNEITGKHLALNVDAHLLLTGLSISFFTGLIAGSYPAFYLSGFKPVTVLKGGAALGRLNTPLGELWVRKGLVVFQFTLSVIFIVSVLVVYKQMKLVQTMNLGYDKDNIISFKNEGRLNRDFQPFLSELKNISGVVTASSCRGDLMGNYSGSTERVDWEGKKAGQIIEFLGLDIDYDFMEMLDIKIAEGRTFSRQFGSDSSKIMLNQAAVDAMGLKNPIGKTVKFWGVMYQIIGVVKNFHFESLYEKVKPCLIRCTPAGSNIFVKIKAGKEKETIERINQFYREYNQGLPFEYKFLDEEYQALYASEQRVTVLSQYFAGIAILISCLGLFGLAAFTAERRRKEIGIRKVLGSSEWRIVYLLSGEFTKLVFVSILIALPVSYLLTKHWLDNFAYRIPLQAWYFVGAGLLALLIALLTVSFQAIKAAMANPVNSLRNE